MSLTAAVLLGTVQGLTEFLPISSSGHLVIVQHFIPHFHQPGVLFDIALHLGTLGSILIYFRREVATLANGCLPGPSGSPGRRLLMLLGIGTVPAVILGIFGRAWIEQIFMSLFVVGIALCITGLWLLFSARFPAGGRNFEEINLSDALLIGMAQSFALVPGISRSGSTIVAGLTCGLSRATAARFSFLLSIPSIFGAAVFNMPSVSGLPSDAIGSYLVGFLTAFVVGYFAINAVLRFLAHQQFHRFGYYCLTAGGFILVYVTR